MPKRTDRISDRASCWNEHVDQKATAVWRRRDFLDEQTVDAIIGIVIFECEVQGSLDLPAELLGLSLFLPVVRRIAGLAST